MQDDEHKARLLDNLVRKESVEPNDDMSFYKSITGVHSTTSQEKSFQIRRQIKFQSYMYFRWCFLKYSLFACVATVYMFVAEIWECDIGFLPLYSILILFVIVTAITLCIMNFMSGLPLWILNMFTSFDFLYFAFKSLQCEDKDKKTCKLFKEGGNVLSIIDIVIGIMIILWICSILLYCFRNICDCARCLRENCIFYLLVIIWITVIGVTITCSVWQAIEDNYSITRLIIRIVVAISALDTFVLQTTRDEMKALIQRHINCLSDSHPVFVDGSSADSENSS